MCFSFVQMRFEECLESIHKSFFSLSQPTSSFETILIKKVKYYSFKTFTRWNFENWKKQNKNSIPNIKLKPRLMICFWFLIEGVMPLLIYVLKPKRIHTVILEYFNMKMNKLFLILPSSLFRYSLAPKTKRIFQMLWCVFEMIQFIHFYPLFEALGRSLRHNLDKVILWHF